MYSRTRIRTRATSVRSHTGAAAVRGGRTNAETRPQGMGTCNCVNGTMADGPSLESPTVETRFWLTPEFYHSAAALFTRYTAVAPLPAREIAATAEISFSLCFDYLLFFFKYLHFSQSRLVWLVIDSPLSNIWNNIERNLAEKNVLRVSYKLTQILLII